MTSRPHLTAPPVLSTPESHIFEDPTPVVDTTRIAHLTDEEILVRYEIYKTIDQIIRGGWRRIGLQFPDDMVGDSVKVYGLLKKHLQRAEAQLLGQDAVNDKESDDVLETRVVNVDLEDQKSLASGGRSDYKLCILADTSYGSCCVDEIAAEHVDAEVVVHYGRSCLSPTARLPVIYVFTAQNLNLSFVIQAFKNAYEDRSTKVLLLADLPYQSHLSQLSKQLQEDQYTDVLVPEVVHSPAAVIPNRTLPADASTEIGQLKDYALFHIGQPPPALLLTLASRVSSIQIYAGDSEPRALQAFTTPTLRRRYALLTSVSTVPIFGILINTLSVKNYLHVVTHVQRLISSAGKKSYTFVVGKVNPAKVANFAEIGGWVVVGCWESSLVESRDFYRPLITPFELELALTNDKDRLWSGEWRSDFDAVLARRVLPSSHVDDNAEGENNGVEDEEKIDDDDDEESAPPEFDLRTGRYVSHSRPMQLKNSTKSSAKSNQQIATVATGALTKRATGDLAQVGGVISPGAEFLISARSWRGLGSDYEIKYDEPATQVEEGRSGIAREYTVAENAEGLGS